MHLKQEMCFVRLQICGNKQSDFLEDQNGVGDIFHLSFPLIFHSLLCCNASLIKSEEAEIFMRCVHQSLSDSESSWTFDGKNRRPQLAPSALLERCLLIVAQITYKWLEFQKTNWILSFAYSFQTKQGIVRMDFRIFDRVYSYS